MNCVTVNHITPIIKVADFCNFTCDFCRYPNNPHKSSMPFSTFRTIIEKACEYNFSNNYYVKGSHNPFLKITISKNSNLFFGWLKRFRFTSKL